MPCQRVRDWKEARPALPDAGHAGSFTERAARVSGGLESGAAEHLAFEHLDPAGVSFDYAATPGQGEAGDDDIAVAVNAWDQGVQTGWVVLVDSIEPFGKPLVLALSELF